MWRTHAVIGQTIAVHSSTSTERAATSWNGAPLRLIGAACRIETGLWLSIMARRAASEGARSRSSVMVISLSSLMGPALFAANQSFDKRAFYDIGPSTPSALTEPPCCA